MTKPYSEMARKIVDKVLPRPDWVSCKDWEDCFVCGTPLSPEKYAERSKYIVEEIAKALEAVAKERDGEIKRLQDADVVSDVLRMENKKIGGTLAEICKLLRDSGVEKKYFDQADNESLRLRLERMDLALEQRIEVEGTWQDWVTQISLAQSKDLVQMIADATQRKIREKALEGDLDVRS